MIAFGTRGDVQPLVVLAAGISSRSTWCSEVLLLTHQLHAGFVEPLLKLSRTEPCESLVIPQLATVDSPPVLWKGQSLAASFLRVIHVFATDGEYRSRSSRSNTAVLTIQPPQQCSLKVHAILHHPSHTRTTQCVQCVFGTPYSPKGTSGSDATEARANLAQQNGCMEACRGASLIIFNMFALEGFHVSEAYNVSLL